MADTKVTAQQVAQAVGGGKPLPTGKVSCDATADEMVEALDKEVKKGK